MLKSQSPRAFLPPDPCRSPCSGTAFLVSRIFLPAKPEVTAGYGKLFAKAGIGLWAVWKVYEQFCIRTERRRGSMQL